MILVTNDDINIDILWRHTIFPSLMSMQVLSSRFERLSKMTILDDKYCLFFVGLEHPFWKRLLEEVKAHDRLNTMMDICHHCLKELSRECIDAFKVLNARHLVKLLR